MEDAFGPLNDFPRFEFLGELRTFFFEAGHLDFRAYQETDGGDEANFEFAVAVWLAVLQINDADDPAAAQEWHGQKGLEAVFGKLVEKLKARILKGVARDGPVKPSKNVTVAGVVETFEM